MTVKTLIAAAAALFMAVGAAQASTADCEKQAADKKLHGAAKNSFVKKCSGDAAPPKSAAAETCDKTAAEKKLAGAAKNSFVKKCVKDAEGGAAASAPAKK
jgi:hypothetical protein